MMKYFLLRVVITMLLPVLLFSGAPDTLWTKTYGGVGEEYGHCVEQTSDGGYIVTGSTSSSGAGASDVWLIKTDSSGDTLWTRTYGGIKDDEAYSVRQTQDGGYVMVGRSFSRDSCGDVYLVKTNTLGDTLWTRSFGWTEYDCGDCVQQTEDGGYIITGNTWPVSEGKRNLLLIKTDSLGDTLWTRIYGGDKCEHGYSVEETLDGGYIVTGYTFSFSAGATDVWLVKTDSSGDTTWTRSYGGSGSEGGEAVRQAEDGGYIVAGYAYPSGASDRDVWLLKTDSSGDTVWTRTYSGSENAHGTAVELTSDTGYVVAGWIESSKGSGCYDVLTLKTDSTGDIQWIKTPGGADFDYGYCVKQTDDHGYIIAGRTMSFGAGGGDLWLIRLGPETGAEERNRVSRTERSELRVTPNPFTTRTVISYSSLVGARCVVPLQIYDLGGRLVEETGQGVIGKELESGVYFVKVKGYEPVKMVKVR
jgi:hypothetical protein